MARRASKLKSSHDTRILKNLGNVTQFHAVYMQSAEAKNFRNIFVYRRLGWKSFDNQNYEKQLIIIPSKCLFSHEEIPLQRFCVLCSVPYLIVFIVISTDNMFYVIRSSIEINLCIIINVGGGNRSFSGAVHNQRHVEHSLFYKHYPKLVSWVVVNINKEPHLLIWWLLQVYKHLNKCSWQGFIMHHT